MTENIWSYRPEAYSGEQTLGLVGFDVEATDGKIGSVDEESDAVGDSYIVVDTGFWIFGKKVVLPAGTVIRVDPQERKVYISRTKEEIKQAPEFDEATYREPDYRDRLSDYYGAGTW
ncbi:PRC-barrel domain containing protein [Streptosporangium sp. NBC_01639]|uniref:PRC-barrel domain containing protein n=1 Tax=Streptosporangium sp. NBC_01639 TaxID=2975948 RepID=UPI00386D3E1D|nr:PRC-barrel domain containing protein [Streptosporangium sp. NBC_01639]